MEVIKREAIPAAEARNRLKKLEKAKEPAYEQKITIEFLKKNIKTLVTNSRKMMQELESVGRVKKRQASMIVNIMPENEDEVRMIFSKERMRIKSDEVKKILEIVKKYEKK